MKHNQSEWRAIGSYVMADKDCIAICDTDNAAPEEMKANARLMAAAPDLLAICKRQQEELRLIRMKDCDAVYDPLVRIGADVAINKAEGRE